MVTVPTYERSVADRPLHQQGFTSRATPDDFGAAIGRGLQSLAQGGQQASDALGQVQELEDVAAAKEADNALAEWSREAMYGENGYMTLEGRAAVDGRSAFEKAWEEKRREIGVALKPGASRHYAEASMARKQQVLTSGAIHAANARKQWIKDASAARVDTFAEDALADFGDPRKVDFNLAAGQAELRQQAELEGWDADTLQNREDEFISGVRKNIALRMAQTDPIAAQAYVEEHRTDLTGTHQYELEGALQDAVKHETAKREAARIMDLIDAGEPVDIEAELKGIEDDDVRILTDSRVNALVAAETAASEASVKQAKAALFEVVEKGGTPDDLPFEVRQAAGMDAVSSAWSYVERRNGGTMVSNEKALYDLRLAAATDPVAFSKLDLNDFRDQLAPDAIKELTALQTAAIKDERKAREDGSVVTGAFRQAGDALEAVGLTTVGLTGKDREQVAERIAGFQSVLYAQIAEFRAQNDGRAPTFDEIDTMVNRLLLPAVIGGGGNDAPIGFGGTLFGGGKRDGFLFEGNTRGDGEKVDVAVKYEDIPADLRGRIMVDLERELGYPPSPEQVVSVYEIFSLSAP